MMAKEYEETMTDSWLPLKDVEKVNDPCKFQFLPYGSFSAGIISWKGGKCVPVLISNDLMNRLDFLCKHRSSFGIKNTNPFLFATKTSNSHCSGWHAFREVCLKTVITKPITATKMQLNF
ncbi:hypothetical protein SNE40_010695 [Patella caerulea]|uniref:Uncharacterized protein n=1 Tax=Patella caerulea TaxID=87958 RepID=A0AAN8JSI0_PATCE